ncbi:MAG: 5-bromo-4-chloroindolyl phosphate hydrolysis family protein, partial [Faecalibacterium sp.]|nr:5-bromo-4-chloroindolyl phosphate hydrolysis family protein [Faecalibacterium sp.]
MQEKRNEFDYSTLYGAPSNGTSGPRQTDAGAASAEQAALQRELEQQLQALSQSVTDGIRHGFEGRGQELGDRAVELGGTVLDMVSLGLKQARAEMEKKNAEGQQSAAQNHRFGTGARRQGPPAHVKALRAQSGKRLAWGLGLTIPCGIVAGGLLLGSLITLIVWLATMDPDALLAAALCGVVALPFAWPALIGIANLKAFRRIRAYARIIGERTSISVPELAASLQRPAGKVRKELRKYLNKGWLTGWLDETTDELYLTSQAWQTAQLAKQQPAPQPVQPQQAQEGEVSCEAIERFARVLGTECRLMTDPQAVEQLQKMQTTSRAIGAWVAAHPESAGKARRFVTYYMPTTLKLLHTYNEVKDQNDD